MPATHRLYRGFAASLMLGLGLLQAWDSGALSSPLHVLLQLLAAVLLPPGAVLLSKRGGVWAAAVTVSAVLLWVARLTAPRPLPALTLVIGFQVAVLYLLFRTLSRERRADPEPSASAEEVRA
jgi:uncharacterized membrane protein YqaE (UPF0057 family)